MSEPFSVDCREALRYLGFRGKEADEATAALLKQAADRLVKMAQPRTIWKQFSLAEDEEGLYLPQAGLRLAGRAVQRHLCGCRQCILMAATLGLETDRLLQRTQLQNMALAATMDACASAAIEDVCNRLCRKLIESSGPLTARFSPGYGDLPLTLQRDFIRLLDAPRKIGLTLTESCMLTPQKSVTAVMGILPEGMEKSVLDRCGSCDMRKHCPYRSEQEGD
ncbi:MAG: hypothetical protein HFG27_07615 [Provencibacterium sp.]|nr:hypothetical protein [Provencibacterium sp.]